MSLAVSPLNLGSRSARDVCFAAGYGALSVASIGIFAVSFGPAKATLDSLVANCSEVESGVETGVGRLHQALAGDDSSGGGGRILSDLMHAAPYLGTSLIFSLILGVLWMGLLRFFAKPVVYVTLVVKGFVLVALGWYGFKRVSDDSSCHLTEGDCTSRFYPLLLVAAGLVYFLWLCCARNRIRMTAALLEQAVAVVASHPGLFLATAFLLVLMALSAVFAIAALLLLAASQVTLSAPQPPTAAQSATCTVEWEVGGAGAAAYAVLLCFLYWSIQLWMAARYYVISLTTGVWYFENESLAAQEGAVADKEYTAAPVCASLRQALGKGFGTVAFASLVTTICEWLKALARREGRDGGLIGCLVACCIQCILSYVEFINRFALTFSALTGDALCASGRTFLGHCRRHGLLKVLVIDQLAAITLQLGALVLALAVGVLTSAVVDGTTHVHDDDRSTVLLTVGGVGWLLAACVLSFVAGILLNVVDAAYSCLVLDLDNAARVGSFNRPPIAQAVFVKVAPEYVVVQPDGSGLSYARHQAAAHPAVPMGLPVHGQP